MAGSGPTGQRRAWRLVAGFSLALALLLAMGLAGLNALAERHHWEALAGLGSLGRGDLSPESKAVLEQEAWFHTGRALELNPGRADYWLTRTRFLESRGHPEAYSDPMVHSLAWKSAVKAASRAPLWFAPYLGLARLCSGLDSASGQKALCGELFAHAAGLNGTYAFIFESWADYLYQQTVGRDQVPDQTKGQLMGLYARALELNQPRAPFRHSDYYLALEDRAYSRAIYLTRRWSLLSRLRPVRAPQWGRLAQALLSQGGCPTPAALAPLVAVMAESPGREEAGLAVIKVLEQSGCPRLAVELFRDYPSGERQSAVIWMGLIDIMARYRDYFSRQERLDAVSQAAVIKASRPLPDYWSRLGLVLCADGYLEQGARLLAQDLVSGVREGAAFAHLGDSLILAGLEDMAVTAYRIATDKEPGEPEWWTRLGLAQARKGDYARAVASLEKALELEPSHRDTRRAMKAMGIY